MSAPVALVTGSARGIGAATVALLADEGWRVVAVDRNPTKSTPRGGRCWEADLRDPESLRYLVASVSEKEGRLDLLVNNAAIQVAASLEETSNRAWDETIAVNLRAPFLLIREACGLLAGSRGSVVNVASVHAIATSVNIAAYAASKGGLVALTRALAVELAPRGIRVNAVLPGAIDTAMLDAGLDRGHFATKSAERRKAELARRTVAGRIGTPAEIALAVLFLADGNRSSFITGQALVIDGGATARLSTE